MPTNPFFNNFNSTSEQGLIEDLIIESIKIYGIDVYYLPRSTNNIDPIYLEDPRHRYDSYYGIEMYIRNVDKFGGDGEFLSKFNLEIRDTITFTIAHKSFQQYISSSTNIQRPREGDLIYFPLNRKMFKITFVEHEPVFYQFGTLQMYDVKCELFEYSNEVFETGNEELDALYMQYSTVLNNLDDVDPLADNTPIEEEANQILDFTEFDPFSEGTY